MSAILTLEKHNTDKVVKYVDELKRLDIELRPPNINYSDLNFQADKIDDKNVDFLEWVQLRGLEMLHWLYYNRERREWRF